MLMPQADSRTSRATRAAASGAASTSSRAAAFSDRRYFRSPISTTTPPPMVTTGENMRMMKRSPGQQQRRLAQHQPGIGRRSRRQNLPVERLLPRAQQPHFGLDFRRAGMEVHRRAMLQRLGGGQQFQAAIDVPHGSKPAGLGEHVAARRSPPARCPARLMAVRCPATAASAGEPCTSTPRTRSRRPAGYNSTSCSLRTAPEISVPVTTVPKPFTENDAVDGQAEIAARVLLRHGRRRARQLLAQLVQARRRSWS